MKQQFISLDNDQAIYYLSSEVLIKNTQDILDLIGGIDANAIVLHDYNFTLDFFDLSTRKLGEVLQKLANYHLRMAIIGDFTQYPSKVLPDLIRESNRHGDYLFVDSLEKVKKIWNQ